ncbi:MAG: peptide chain release factor N(5)-glutamine methyltransferase [Bacillota bacterium]|nr:MAG: peptide chain release factor N(5)-glutamine methyltransferase [Bacillota bacterium]
MSDSYPQPAGEVLRRATQALRLAGCQTPRLDAEVLLCHVAGTTRETLLAHPELALEPGTVRAYREAVERRRRGCPVAYITGGREFMGLEFEVGPGVLVPRPETELLVSVAVDRARALGMAPGRGLTLADVGTGSGAVAVTLCRLLPGCRVYALDTSPQALATAERNAARLGVGENIVFYRGDLLSALSGEPGLALDGVVANLPYVRDDEWSFLPTEVRDYEPKESLTGGPDGLDLFRRLALQLPAFLGSPAFVCLEAGPGQAQAVGGLLWGTGQFRDVFAERDLAGVERVVWATRPGPGEVVPAGEGHNRHRRKLYP